NTMFAAYAITLIYVALHWVFREPMLTYFGAKGETLELARSIYLTCLISILNDSGLFIFFSILRATGYINRHFYRLFDSIALNTVFEPVFIYGWLGFPRMGILGAPMARFISYLVTTCIMIFILTNTRGILHIGKKDLHLDLKFLLEYIKVSLPAWGQGLVQSITGLVMLKIAAPYGDRMLATMGIGSRLDNFLFMIGWSISGSASVMVGHNLGAGKVDRAETSITTGLKVYSLFTLGFFMLYFNFPAAVIGIFSHDPGIINFGSSYLKIVSPFYLLMGVGLMTGAAFNGAGSTKTPMVINFIAFLGLQIPIAIILSRVPAIGYRAIFIGIAAVFVFQCVAGWVMYKKGHWKAKEL
ncbi:MAG: hypothetical protein LLG37_00765, partial [Spirochaetia bacterium]|nr:hypothetical protein [Spirochaetia bacterium]